MGRRAQISAEFFIFLGLAFLVSIGFMLASLDQLNDFRTKKEGETVRDVALKLQKEVLVASNVEDGYVRTFTIPDVIDRINYTITTINSTITVESAKGIYLVSIPAAIGNLTKGKNTINKTGGVIYIN